MHKKFEINRTKIMGGCQSAKKVVTHNSKTDLPLVYFEKFSKARKIDYATICYNNVVKSRQIPLL